MKSNWQRIFLFSVERGETTQRVTKWDIEGREEIYRVLFSENDDQ